MSEWLESNKTRAYPFTRPVADLDEALIDATITIPGSVADLSTENEEQKLVIEHLDLAVIAQGSSHVAIADNSIEGGTTLFDSRVDTHTFDSYASSALTVAHWFNDEYSVKLVFDTTNLAGLAWTQASAIPLTASTIIMQPSKVTSVVADGTTMDPDDPIILAEGYNCELEVTPNILVGGERRDVVLVTFRPGAGQGRLSDCDDPDILLRRINGVEPDTAGNFNFAGDECMFLRPYHVGDDAGMTLLTYCVPCCSCDEMVLTHAAMKQLLDTQQTAILPSLYNARDDLHTGIQRYNAIVNDLDGSAAFHRVYCRGQYVFHVQAILMNGTDSAISSDLTFTPRIDDALTVTGFAVTGSGYIFGDGSNQVWTAQDVTENWTDGYETSVTIPAGSWRGYQFELSVEKGKGSADLSEFSCDFDATNISGSWSEETCDIVGVTCGEDCE